MGDATDLPFVIPSALVPGSFAAGVEAEPRDLQFPFPVDRCPDPALQTSKTHPPRFPCNIPLPPSQP
jgi:hypothetical protein